VKKEDHIPHKASYSQETLREEGTSPVLLHFEMLQSLVLSTALVLKEQAKSMPQALVCISPWVDLLVALSPPKSSTWYKRYEDDNLPISSYLVKWYLPEHIPAK
jgi:hypothetical protein